MNIKKIKIVYMSNGLFGVPTLKYLIKKKLNICSIVTSKKNIINNNKNYIKLIAIKKKINLLYSENINKKYFYNKLLNIKPDLLILISFKIIKKKIWKISKINTINIHPSLLPNYSGSCPINWVIINNEKYTGLTSFKINNKIDNGKIIKQIKIKINNKNTFYKLYNYLSYKSKFFIYKTIKKLIKKNKYLKKKKINNLKLAPKINNYYSKIYFFFNFNKINNLINGLSKKKPAWCFLNTKNKILLINIYKIKIINYKHNYNYGLIKKNKIKKKILITNKKGFIELKKIKIENKKINKNKEIYNNFFNKKKLFCF
ncbi:MAG: hypothetical protein NHF95_00785 [Candidatus Shikimatogenerans sp. JK-2022]|nr:hypothetical protein [Candidatus Shikimatogenerans bostrichidophilus]